MATSSPPFSRSSVNSQFDGFLYATASYHLRPNNDERIYYFTTLPLEWVTRYDQRAYVECDPRVLYSFESALPLVWDQASERGKNPKTDAFLLDAAAHGVGSGVAFPVYAGYPARTLVSLSYSTAVDRRGAAPADRGQPRGTSGCSGNASTSSSSRA